MANHVVFVRATNPAIGISAGDSLNLGSIISGGSFGKPTLRLFPYANQTHHLIIVGSVSGHPIITSTSSSVVIDPIARFSSNAVFGTSTVSIPSGNGEGQISAYAAYGLTFIGQGSTYDMIGLNKSGSLAWSVATGTTNFAIVGALSKGSGTFDIEHPLNPSKRLRHSFIEGPRYDLIYRNRVRLVKGRATVDLDRDCTDGAPMTPGTFEALTVNPSIYLQNAEGWTRLRGTIKGATLAIEAEDPACADLVEWMVIAERDDKHINEGAGGMANEHGDLILEYSNLTVEYASKGATLN
jgi:hypothetical protein